jgi:predicted Zn-dependent protease
VMTLPDPGDALPYIQTAWRYARGVALVRSGDTKAAASELNQIERIVATTDYKPFDAWKIPAKEVGQIAAHVLRARIAQAGNDIDGALREMHAAIKVQDSLPYMEPAYWYYPVRQSLGALLLQKGDTQGAREAFGESLARTPNNSWSLYGLSQAYAREGKVREAKAVEDRFTRAWSGGKAKVDLTAL